MELQLERDSQKAVQIQEQKVQLEEAVVKLRHSEREMRSTLEKFTASIQVPLSVLTKSTGIQQQFDRSILLFAYFFKIETHPPSPFLVEGLSWDDFVSLSTNE